MIKANNEKFSTHQIISIIIGFILFGFGIFIIAHCLYLADPNETICKLDEGGRVAFGFFLIMLGMPFFFPDLLQGDNGNTSMRIVVFMIVSVFVIITIKLGWSVEKLSEFSIDNSWRYIIGITLGGQVAQNFVERKFK